MNNKKGLTSTIVMGIFIAITIVFVVLLLNYNLHEEMQKFVDGVKETQDNSEETGKAVIATVFVAGIGGMVIVIVAFLLIIVCATPAIIMLPFSIKNRHLENETFRIFSYVYDVILSSILVICIVKLILFLTIG